MKTHTYRAETIHDALQMVRDDLGPNALVLRTREVRTGGLLGLMNGQRCLEVTASIDQSHQSAWHRPAGPMDQGIDLGGKW